MILTFLELSDKQALERSLTMECNDSLMSPIHNVRKTQKAGGQESPELSMTHKKSTGGKSKTGPQDGWKN